MTEENLQPNLTAEEAVRQFYAQCPAFVDNVENWHILAAFLPGEFERLPRNWPTTDQLLVAYNLAKENGHFQ